MKNIVKGLLVATMITPVALNAFGMGLSVPVMTNVKHDIDGGGTLKEDSISGFSLAPAVGVNIHLGSVVSLGLDMDYKIDGLSATTRESDYGGESDATLSGMTARFYVLFKFGDKLR